MKLYDVSELKLFDDYNPFSDELPESLKWQAGFIVQRACLILKNRSIDQLKSALLTLRRWRIAAYSQPLPALFDEYSQQDAIFFSTSQIMYFTRDEIDLTQHNTEEFDIAELFATLALGNLGAIISADPDDAEDSLAIQQAVIEAVEAIGFAEAAWVDKLAKEQRSQGRKQGHSDKYGLLKRRLVLEYQQFKSGISNRQAALLLLEIIPQELLIKIQPGNELKRLEEWIGQYKKGKLSDVGDLPAYKDDR